MYHDDDHEGEEKEKSKSKKDNTKRKKSTIHAVYDVEEVKGPKECLRPVVVEEERERKEPSLNSNEGDKIVK